MRTHCPLSMFKTVQVNHYDLIPEKPNISNGPFFLFSMDREHREHREGSIFLALAVKWNYFVNKEGNEQCFIGD